MSAFQRVRGLQPASMIDWPGKLCSVIFLGGCNFRCPYCHNPELVEEKNSGEALAWGEVLRFLQGRRGWIDGVVITGGEPCIHADLPLMCAELRSLGFAVRIDTNGSRPQVLRNMLQGGVLDAVAMDLKTSLERYPGVVRRPVDPAAIRASAEAILECGLEHEFRCTVVPGLVGFEDLEELARMIRGASSLVLQQFRPQVTLDPEYGGARGYEDEVLARWAEMLSEYVPTRVRGLVGMRAS
ncbi:MAG: anaerobic ribonucleoside-triphosphate reductase activating protein [Actinomycetota bacterium]|nr:anaerobic ribonucleoside-triphosphate reductase activating protein [Actinomycetota bacterium]